MGGAQPLKRYRYSLGGLPQGNTFGKLIRLQSTVRYDFKESAQSLECCPKLHDFEPSRRRRLKLTGESERRSGTSYELERRGHNEAVPSIPLANATSPDYGPDDSRNHSQ